LIESFPCEQKIELERREGEVQLEFKGNGVDLINEYVAGRTKKEWYEQNRELLLEKYKEYYENNRVQINERQNQKIPCPDCAKEISRQNMTRHRRTHLK